MAVDRRQPRPARRAYPDPRGRPSFRLFGRRYARAGARGGVSLLLRFEGVALRRGGRLLFDNLSFELEAGARLQVAGPNGSGKSSLLRLAAGLLRQEHG